MHLANTLIRRIPAAMTAIDEFAEGHDAPAPTPAATLVIFRRDPAGGAPQILMIERAATMSFAGGAAVFPGGRVDDADRDLAAVLGACDDEELHELAARIAAVRETIEETGLVVGVRGEVTLERALAARAMLLEQGKLAPVLDAMGWQVDPSALLPFARWWPKHRHIRVYDTRFYLYDLGTGAVDILADASETTHFFWASAAESLELADQGKIKIIFPTRRNLERLAMFGDFAEAQAHVAIYPSQIISPFVVEDGGERWLSIPEDSGYPVTRERLDLAARG